MNHQSLNITEILGLDEPLEFGSRLGDHISRFALERIRSTMAIQKVRDQVERLFALDLMGDGRLFDCALHSSGPYSVIEIEPHKTGDLDRQIASLKPVIARLEKHDSLVDVCNSAARQLKMLLGFDRVMVYRFQPDQSGEVIAESRDDDLESFLGLHYPRSDIPEQARALYLRNRFRIISDVHSDPSPIVPGLSLDGEPLDLSMSSLRAVSPIHIEYLRNMGVEASLSISIIVGGKLWGLFACHNHSPKILPYSQRTAMELFSELFSLVLDRFIARQQAELHQRGREVHDRLMRDVAAGKSLGESIPDIDPTIQSVIQHDGISIFMEGIYDSRGSAPSEEQFRTIIPILNGAATSRIFASDAMSERIPAATDFVDVAAGALVLPISRTPRDYLVLWRREKKRNVTWAGNPQKAVQTGPNGTRLTPRESFEAWKEEVAGRSQPWAEAEIQIAESLRVTMLEMILRVTDAAVSERAKAQQQQELLIAELNHRVRNILNLIRGLINQSRHEAMDIHTFVDIIGGRINSLASAHDNITKENWSPAPLSQLIDAEADAYLAGKTDRLHLSGPEVLVSPEAYTVLALVVHEMITNSAKYGSLSDQRGNLDIGISRSDDDDLLITWCERGGPRVKEPTRRGFGSTIIERSIPFELNGKAEISYPEEGVEATFCIPSRFVTWGKSAIEERVKADTPAEPQTGSDIPETVLLVEDSMIIALDAEDCMRELGAKNVHVASTVSSALDALKKIEPDLAILDYNLGSENSERVAAALAERGIVFWLATGYGEMSERLDEIGAKGLLVKPYGKDDLARVVAQYSAGGR